MPDEDQDIGFQDPDQEDMPSEMKDHWLAAFRHEAGLGPHPGAYTGPRRKKHDPDEPTESDRDSARQEEANARKMRAAQTGGASETGLGPSDIDKAQIKQRDASQQQTATQGAQAAAQAQGAQAPVNAPAAPTGPTGVSAPYPAQRAPQPPPSATQGLPASGMNPPPEAPGDGGEEPSQ